MNSADTQQRPQQGAYYFDAQQPSSAPAQAPTSQRHDDDPSQPPATTQQSQPGQSQQQPPQPAAQQSFSTPFEANGQAEQAPASGDGDADDSDDQLSVQTLNADGTPKRPMNAFLLYAKKRRPQISTNHPTMRTGEISKVLSKEWQNMPKSDKQYYQDRAKKLKDSFNLRWPDYVYKRRPNNSRKKRRGIPSTDSPTIEEGGQRDGDGGEGDAYGEGSGGDDATASPNLSLRLPHERDEARMGGPGGLPGYSAQPAPADHRANPLPPNGAPMGGPRMPYPPNGPQAGGYGGYDDQPPYGANGGTPYTTGYYPPMPNAPSQPPPRNNPPSVWNHQGGHDPNRSPYDTPRSASTTTGYSPVTDGDQQWGAGRPSAGPSPINTSWQNPMHGQPPAGPLSATARPGGPRSSADNSPIQPPGDAFRGPRPPPTPQSAGPRPFANLNAPMYGGPGGPGLPRTDSPTSYNAGYGYAGGPAPNGQPPSNSGYGHSPMLPPLTDPRAPPHNQHHGHNPYPSPREPNGILGGDDRSRLGVAPGAGRQTPGDRREGGTVSNGGMYAHYDPVKGED